MRPRSLSAFLLALLALAYAAHASSVFQYALPVERNDATPADIAKDPAKAKSLAFLWIPPAAKQVRGIVIGGMTVAERELVKDDQVRAACAAQQLGIIFLKTGLNAVNIQTILDDFAKTSGYAEISVAPLFFVGHSAGGPQARDNAIKYADRCFGLMQYRGGPPWDGAGVRPGIPTLMMVGEYDEYGGTMRHEDNREHWMGIRDALGKRRTADENYLASIIVEPGAGHFPWSDRNAAYLALFIKKAAAARIPDTFDADKPVTLKSIDVKSGYLTDLAFEKPAAGGPAASYADFNGEKALAQWHFDKEIADATVQYHTGGFGKKDQFIKWSDPYWVDAGTRFFFQKITWVGDGQTFEVHPLYNDKYPGQYDGKGPIWPWAGKPVGQSTAPILVRMVSGPIVHTSPNTLRIVYDELAPASEPSRPTFLAYSLGDKDYRYTEQVGMLPRGFNGLGDGAAQTIQFDAPPANLRADADPLTLHATSTSQLLVNFHVAYGPAKIVDSNKLVLTDIPARAKFPIQIKVYAYQFGRGLDPKFKTAQPVEQLINITGK